MTEMVARQGGQDKGPKQPAGKMKITLSLSRSALAGLDLIRARRLELGASRRDVQNSRLVQEAIELLKQKDGV